jgi:hypothetical protein
MMKKSSILFATVITMLMVTSTSTNGQKIVPTSHHTQVDNDGEAALRAQMRRLWGDHVIWTRNMIFCLVDNLPGKDQVLERLLQNQDEIGFAFEPYYGSNVCENLSLLLREHIGYTIEVINATKSRNEQDLDQANKHWYLNADKISELLSKQNPHWLLSDLTKMMNWHQNLTIEEANQRINKDYTADVRAFDKVRMEIMTMSDMLANGIIKQFPTRFIETGSFPK